MNLLDNPLSPLAPYAKAIRVGVYVLAGSAALALFANTYADIRIPLPLLPDIHIEGWKPKAQRLQREIDGFADAQEQARILAEQQLRAKEREYADKARKADDEYDHALALAGDATDRYIAAHRVCEADRGPTGPTSAGAADNGSGVPSGMPPDALVAVEERDVRTVGDLYAYALTCRSFVVGLAR